jgi:2-polyprenyl-3-methyl-5-hydroxy-6-metoxy-1,4-benzoquinol methylase
MGAFFSKKQRRRYRSEMKKTMVCILRGDDLGAEETETAGRVLAKLLRTEKDELQWIVSGKEMPYSLEELLRFQECDAVIFLQSTAFITYEGIRALSKIVGGNKTFDVVAPVSNESSLPHQRYAPPFLYQTISVFQWASEEIYGSFRDTVQLVGEIDRFCFALSRETLGLLPKETAVDRLPDVIREKGMRCGIAKGVYVHRYGNIYESGREDLLAYVPNGAKEILDVGCARGLFGELLKKRQECRVTGVDMDNSLLAYAKERIDAVIEGDIEEIIEKGMLKTYDCIVCGDILEHLRDPWKVVGMLARHLNDKGLFIASTPNINNWAILHELLNGEWNYVPFSILSGAHIRFFTRKTLTGLFQGAGYRVKETHLHGIGVPPRGEEFIDRLMNILPEIDKEELMASEIILVAERLSS